MNANDSPHVRLDWHLSNWRTWMHLGATKGLRAPGKSAGFVGGGYSTDFESMCEEADSRSAQAMDAMIESLSAVEQAAIHHRYLHAVYRFPRGGFEQTLQQARERLIAGMSARCLV